MKKTCHFEIPALPADWCRLEDEDIEYNYIIYANPGRSNDAFLKKQYFDGIQEQGLGTILIGIAL